jgi:hypothetical protein
MKKPEAFPKISAINFLIGVIYHVKPVFFLVLQPKMGMGYLKNST